MGHEFTPQEKDDIRNESWWIAQAWNEFTDELQNSRVSGGAHTPPAMADLHMFLLTHDNIEASTLGPFDEEMQHKMSTFGDIMFRFGQFCARRGLLHANLTTCNCLDSALEEELNKILGGE
jgi:hypothetical protein